MKTNTFFIILLLCLSFSLFAQKRNYNIGILMDNYTNKTEPILDQLKTQVKAVVGEDAIINFPKESILVNNYDFEKATQNYNLLTTNNIDIILAFGVVNNKVVTSQSFHKKPTILFGAVNKDFTNIDFTKKTSGINNLTYLVESESYLEDFKKFQELTNFKTLGIIIEAPLVEILPLKEVFDKNFKLLKANYKLIPFKTVSDITSNLDGIDAVYIAGGFFLKDDEIKLLAETFIEKKLPSFSVNGVEDVQQGIMTTNQSKDNFNQFLRRIALTIESYVNGKPLSEMPIFIDYNSRLTMNYNTAEMVKIPIKHSLIASTDFVGEFKNALSKKNYNLLQVIDQVLNKNLSLQSRKADVILSQQDVKTAKSNYLPSLTASGTGTYIDPNLATTSAGQNPEFSTGGNITLSQTIFSEATNANISIQKELQKAQQENFNASELDIIFNATNSYFNTLISKTNAQIQLSNLNLTKRNLQIAQQNFNAGQSGKSDLLRFRSQLAQNTQSMLEAANQMEQSFIVLNQLLNNPIETEIDIEDVELDKGIFKEFNYNQLTDLLDDPTAREPFIAFLIEEAKINAPELKVLAYNLGATERTIKLNVSGRFLPTLVLQGQYNRTFSRSGVGSIPPAGVSLLDDNYNVGLNLSIPILNRNQTNINRQTAIIQKDQLNINKENTEQTISVNIRTSILNVINQVSNINLSKVSEETAKESLELTQVSYASGAVNIIQLIDAQNNYLNAQLARNTAIYNFLINSLQLERNLGYYFLLNDVNENTKFTQRFIEFMSKKN